MKRSRNCSEVLSIQWRSSTTRTSGRFGLPDPRMTGGPQSPTPVYPWAPGSDSGRSPPEGTEGTERRQINQQVLIQLFNFLQQPLPGLCFVTQILEPEIGPQEVQQRQVGHVPPELETLAGQKGAFQGRQ